MRRPPYHYRRETKTRTRPSDPAALRSHGRCRLPLRLIQGDARCGCDPPLSRGKHTAGGRIRQSEGGVSDGRHTAATVYAVCLYGSQAWRSAHDATNSHPGGGAPDSASPRGRSHGGRDDGGVRPPPENSRDRAMVRADVYGLFQEHGRKAYRRYETGSRAAKSLLSLTRVAGARRTLRLLIVWPVHALRHEPSRAGFASR